MATRSKPKKKGSAAPHPPAGGEVFITFLAVVVSVKVGVAWLTPAIVTVPFVLHLVRRPRSDDLFRRWALTILFTTAAATAFAPAHTFESVLQGHSAPRLIDAWMEGGADAPLGARFMLLTGLVYVLATLSSVGVAGALVYSTALSINAVYAVYLCSKGYNVAQMALVAISPWQWCFLGGLYVLFAPLSAFSRELVIRRPHSPGAPESWKRHVRSLAIGAGLVAAAFLVRALAGGAYEALVRRWTVY